MFKKCLADINVYVCIYVWILISIITNTQTNGNPDVPDIAYNSAWCIRVW